MVTGGNLFEAIVKLDIGWNIKSSMIHMDHAILMQSSSTRGDLECCKDPRVLAGTLLEKKKMIYPPYIPGGFSSTASWDNIKIVLNVYF